MARLVKVREEREEGRGEERRREEGRGEEGREII